MLWELLPEELQQKVPGGRVSPEELDALWPEEERPVALGPTPWAEMEPTPPTPTPQMRIPTFAKEPSGGVRYLKGDPVEFDADPQMITGETEVSAAFMPGYSMRPPRRQPPKYTHGDPAALAEWKAQDKIREKEWEEEMRAQFAHYPYRDLDDGDVTVKDGVRGTVEGLLRDTVTVRVMPDEVEIAEDALLPRELKYLADLRKKKRAYSFGFYKSQVIPLKTEEERRQARIARRKGAARVRKLAGGNCVIIPAEEVLWLIR
jgi:hypothetical protein